MDKLFIVTNAGEKYHAKWSGVSNIDRCLRFAISGLSFQDAFTVFSDAANTSKIIYEFDGKEAAEYEGYTQLVGIQMNFDDIVITLKGAENADNN